MKKLATLVLCALMLFSAVMPVTTLAKTKKCTHKNTTWVTTSKATCTATGIKVKKCKNCGKILKTKKIAKTAHTYKSKTFTKATCFRKGWKTAWTLLALMEEKSHYRKSK